MPWKVPVTCVRPGSPPTELTPELVAAARRDRGPAGRRDRAGLGRRYRSRPHGDGQDIAWLVRFPLPKLHRPTGGRGGSSQRRCQRDPLLMLTPAAAVMTSAGNGLARR